MPTLRVPLRLGAWFTPNLAARVAVVLSAGLLAASFFLYAYIVRESAFDDFRAFYAGAVAVRQGSSLYGPALAVRDAGFSIAHPTIPMPVSAHPYVYPPAFAIALLPLTLLPFEVASLAWHVANYAMLLGTGALLVRIFFPGLRYRWSAVLPLSAGLALMNAFRASLYNGQVDLLLLLLLTLTLSAFLAHRDVSAGVWLGLALSVKPFLGILLLFLLWKGALRAAVAATVVSTIVVGMSFVLVGTEALADFLAVASYMSGPTWSVSPNNQSPYGFLLRLFSPNPFGVPMLDMPSLVGLVRAVVGIAVVAVLVWFVSRSRSIPHRLQGLEYGLVIIAMLLLSPVSQPNHFVYLTIPIVALASVIGAARPRSLPQIAALGVIYGYLSLPGLQKWSAGLYRYAAEGPLQAPMSLSMGAHLYGLVMLAVFSVVVAHCCGRLDGTAPKASGASTRPGDTLAGDER